MTAEPSITNEPLLPLLLFLLTSKLWIHHRRKSTPANDALPPTNNEERQRQRKLRLSIDEPEFTKHHFHGEDPSSPLRGQKLTDSVTFLHADCPRWRELMERVSIADSVLTRVSFVMMCCFVVLTD
jgi:hypothetical protein